MRLFLKREADQIKSIETQQFVKNSKETDNQIKNKKSLNLTNNNLALKKNVSNTDKTKKSEENELKKFSKLVGIFRGKIRNVDCLSSK